MVKINLEYLRSGPKFALPQLLQHPHIPGSMAGLNPRSILGQDWWDKTRRAAYAENNYHCHACGELTSYDPYKQWMEAHEVYDIQYEKALVIYIGAVALCHSCHSFIHSGRLWALYLSGNKDTHRSKVKDVITRGMKILDSHGLHPFWGTKAVLYMLNGIPESKALRKALLEVQARGENYVQYLTMKVGHRWRLVVNGKYYRKVGSGHEEVEYPKEMKT